MQPKHWTRGEKERTNAALFASKCVRRLARRCRMLRRWKGLSQRALGERMGCNRSYIAKIESQLILPSLGRIQRLIKALDTPPETLLDSKWTPETAQLFECDELVGAVEETLPRLDQQGRLELCLMIESFCERRQLSFVDLMEVR
jgi:transcriptional regulator with XRE-family HTH domain